MARLGKQIPPSLHGHFASPRPNSFRPPYQLAHSFPSRIRPRSVTFPMSFCAPNKDIRVFPHLVPRQGRSGTQP
jgi:hypothetical protein